MIITTQSENHLLENRFLSSEKAGWVGCVEKVDLKKLNLKYFYMVMVMVMVMVIMDKKVKQYWMLIFKY